MSRDWFEGWSGQYRRMLRWHDRLAVVSQGEDADAVYDFAYAFFQSCHHLRDWLHADGAVSKAELDALFGSSIELRLCRDICNATKHLQYDKPSIDPRPRIGREWDPWTKTAHGWYLYSDARRPVVELARSCIAVWDTFLGKHGLKAASPAA